VMLIPVPRELFKIISLSAFLLVGSQVALGQTPSKTPTSNPAQRDATRPPGGETQNPSAAPDTQKAPPQAPPASQQARPRIPTPRKQRRPRLANNPRALTNPWFRNRRSLFFQSSNQNRCHRFLV
jgi:hypothetical protein